ncbi:MAG: glycosyltransferase family 2 protein [Gammaproteobacteria bacterium]|nr:glycosyltransferase family 2 protein [Gammaproteobacteria bacterium]
MKLSIIIVEYHCMDEVDDCVKSIDKYMQDVEKECLIISNSEYSDDEVGVFQKQLPSTKIINTQGNEGYSTGVNTGIEYASGEYVYVINPDGLVTDSNVTKMMEEMDKEPDWVLSGPQVVDENFVVQPSCRRFPRLWTFLLVRSGLSVLPGADKERARYLMEDFDRKTRKDVDWITGGAMLVKASALRTVGGMDERFFMYMEDVDWCHMCWDKGYKVKYEPCSVVIHPSKHRSIKGSIIDKMMSHHVRMHFISLMRYFMKWGIK